MATPQSAPPKLGAFARFQAATDRVPTKWFAGLATGVFLAATAGFGGLAEAAPTPIGALEIGEEHATEQLRITVEDVVVIDDLPELSLNLVPGQRALVVLANVTNEWDRPLPTTALSTGGIHDNLRVSAGNIDVEAPLQIARVDDALISPVLQPGLQVPLAFIWSVRTSAIRDGDPVEIRLFEESLYTASVVTSGQWWDDPVLAAKVSSVVRDIGAGAEPDDGAQDTDDVAEDGATG